MPFDLPLSVIIIIAIGVLMLIIGVVLSVFWAMTRDSKQQEGPHKNLTIDLLALDVSGPPEGNTQLEFYGTPVRLVVLVLAPVGRGKNLPPKENLHATVDCLVPGLAEILDVHRPIFRQWEGQLSTHGFEHAFFKNMSLPGDNGRGTPWCSVTGKFDTPAGQILAGLVCFADKPNALKHAVVEHEGLWLDVMRVRKGNS